MLFRKNRPFKIGQKVLAIDFDYNRNREAIQSGEIVAKRQRMESTKTPWVYLVKLDDDETKLFEEQQVWLAEEIKNGRD